MFKLRGKQQEILNLSYSGHNIVLGPAGSGKSVCAVQRAKYLARVTDESVLLISFNNSLINYLKDIGGNYPYNVTLRTYHSFAIEYMRKNGLLSDDEILGKDSQKDKLIKDSIEIVKRKEGINRTLQRIEFIIEEIKWMQRIGISDKEQYETMERIGRGGSRLLKENRKYIYQVYEEYINMRSGLGYKYDWDDISYYLLKALKLNVISKKYKHIIIDEGQDFSPTMVKSIVEYAKDDGSVLFLGDTAQQIYGNKVSWKKCGLKIRKVYKLDENHRNTKQIEALANAIKNKMSLDNEDLITTINSNIEGNLPEVIKFNDKFDEIKYVINKVSECKSNESVAIILRTGAYIKEFTDMLENDGISYTKIDRATTNFKDLKGIFIGTYHACKGLEFDNVILPYCTDEDIIEEKRKLALDSERDVDIEISKLIYVGITRARKNLTITYTNKIVSVFPKNKGLYIEK